MRDARRFARAAAAHGRTEMEVPRLAEINVGSLIVVFELVASTVGTLAGFLKLVEHYWNFRLRIALERDRLAVERAQLRQAMEDLEQEALEREVERVDGLSRADERRTKEHLRAREGVLGCEFGEVTRELRQARELEQRRRQREHKRRRPGAWALAPGSGVGWAASDLGANRSASGVDII